MKKLLVMMIVALCAIAWRSPDIMHAISVGGFVADSNALALKAASAPASRSKPMSADEFATLSRTDPQAYQKFINSFQDQDRSEVDKLMNLLARGKYE
ncbi:MAG TPA: hypothetical protein VJ698_18635 [Noviherbaspirillum sp.]|uniref:hypothetical protein n=1 Tax=Noviherbaspirillum sp. TaxID=1926288 RepID=UPI002B48BF98|nr:hypothetical protein [Noviherbaspirillum sp.]HJV87493.1 hypothetical protein [Noviherbaspirillum sp.]